MLDTEQYFVVFLEFKDGRYRVTLSDLGYVDNGVMTDLMMKSLVGVTGNTAKGNLESYNGEFSFNKKNEVKDSGIYANFFEILGQFLLRYDDL